MLPLLAAAGAASAIGGIANYFANQSAAERAEALQNKALQEWITINIPNPKDQEIALKQFVIEGKLNPQLESAIKADPSAFKNIVADSGTKAAQNRALSELSDMGNQGGLRLQDKAALQESSLDNIARERGNRLAVSQQMANRGLGGSGFEVAAQLQGQQGQADRDARSSLDVASKAQDRALQAIMGAGDMATKYRGQDFNEQSARATAEDKINMFNTNNMQDVQQRNIASQNQAAAQNLGEQQRVSDQNTKQDNYQQEYNSKLQQQQFENQAKLAAGKSGQYGQLANNAIQQGQNLGNLYSNMGQGLSSAATSVAKDDFWDEYFKKQKASSGIPTPIA